MPGWPSSAASDSSKGAETRHIGLGRYSARQTRSSTSAYSVNSRLRGSRFHIRRMGSAGRRDEEPFVELLRDFADAEPLPLIRQARRFRTGVTPSPERKLSEEAQNAATATANVLGRELEHSTVVDLVPVESSLPDDLPAGTELFPATIDLRYRSRRWKVTVEISNDATQIPDWFEVAEHVEFDDTGGPSAIIRLRMSLRHPFSERYVGVEYENLELLTRFAAALAIAEITAREAGARQAGEVGRRLKRTAAHRVLRAVASS